MSESKASWFDTHTHLMDVKFNADRAEVVAKSKRSGVVQIVEIADGADEWEKARDLAASDPDFFKWAGGIHPYYADTASDETFSRLQALASDPNFVAVGEVGLDYFKCQVPKETQIHVFSKAIELALQLKKPMVIHCREAFSDLLAVLQKYRKDFDATFSHSPGVIHCFTGAASDAEAILNLGFYVGIDGPLTYPKSDALREIFAHLPLDRIVLETDSPYLPPQTHRGQRNEPAHVVAIGEKLAEIRNEDVDVVAARTHHNGQKLFGLA